MSELLDNNATDLQKLWRETGDVKYAALAVGRRPSDPPPWAIIACWEEHENWLQETLKGSKSADGEALDDIITVLIDDYYDFISNKTGSVSDYIAPKWINAVKRALSKRPGKSIADPEQLRVRAQTLRRRWDEEIEAEGDPCAGEDGVPRTNRYKRMLLAKLLGNGAVPLGYGALALYLEKIANHN